MKENFLHTGIEVCFLGLGIASPGLFVGKRVFQGEENPQPCKKEE